MITRPRWIAGVASSILVGIIVSAGGIAAQVPPVGTPPDSSVPTTPPPPPEEEPPPVPGPSDPPPTVAPGGPGTPAPPSTPVTTAPPPPSSPKTSPAGPGAGAPPPPKAIDKASTGFSLDLSEIDALRRQARGKGPRAAELDQGFDGSLPFQGGPGEGASAPLEDVRELGAEEEQTARVRRAASIAASLIALLLVGLATWFLRQAH